MLSENVYLDVKNSVRVTNGKLKLSNYHSIKEILGKEQTIKN